MIILIDSNENKLLTRTIGVKSLMSILIENDEKVAYSKSRFTNDFGLA